MRLLGTRGELRNTPVNRKPWACARAVPQCTRDGPRGRAEGLLTTGKTPVNVAPGITVQAGAMFFTSPD